MTTKSNGSHQLVVRVTVMGLDPQKASAMALSVATQDIDDALRRAGYETRGVYTGMKGADAFEVLKEVAQTLYANKDLIIALAGLVTPIVTHLLKKREEMNDKAASNPTITVIVAGVRQSIVVNEVLTEEKLLADLLELEPQLPRMESELPPLAIDVVVPAVTDKRHR